MSAVLTRDTSSSKLFWVAIGVFFTSPACRDSPPSQPPEWWEYAADTPIKRFSLLGHPIYEAKQAEISPYYEDSMGYTFLYASPMGGKFWVEYYARAETIRSIALLWEADSFAQMTQLYQLLKSAYTEAYGAPQGVVGDLRWHPNPNLLIVLKLSPERKYLHASFSLLSPHYEDLHQDRR
ncbi:MAG: hypothetical protein ABDH66_07640 [Bacteroidia bacterium]